MHFSQVLQHSPFHPRLEEHNLLKNWMSWNGYQTPRTLDTLASEYFAVRSSCSVMDLTPMEKYRISGPDALRFLNRLVTRDISQLQPMRVTYVVWCNDEGKVLDDGTVFSLGNGEYRLCAQHHQLDWLLLSSLGMEVSIRKETHDVAALSVQGPTAYSVLAAAGIHGLGQLKPFAMLQTDFQGIDLMMSRTGYTGDLGYELWIEPQAALALWDAIFSVRDQGLYDVRTIGLGALELVRIEAGFIMPGDDFITAETAVRADHDRSPFELGLGWIVDFDKPYFTGKRALRAEQQRPIRRKLVKMTVEGNKPPADSFLYDGKKGRRIGTVKSQAWSPILKANLTMADIQYTAGKPPSDIWAEIYYQKELEWHATWAKCTISEQPFWSSPRRVATPPGSF
jgi:aminomethyltransferase